MNEMNGTPSDDTTHHVTSDADLELEFRRIIRYGNKKQICRAILQDFFTDCSIQGFKYFCERKRHWSERVFWVVMFVIATCFSCLMIRGSYVKWDQSPVIVSLSEKASPVWRIPFPAVTICPDVKSSMEKINLTETYYQLFHNFSDVSSMSKETKDRFEALNQICDVQLYPKFMRGENTTNVSLIDTIYDLSIKPNESIYKCNWLKRFGCKDSFRTILTGEGVCFTFNSLNSRDIYTNEYDTCALVAPELLSVVGQPNATNWSLEQGYIEKLSETSAIDFYPRRVVGTGLDDGLNVVTFLKSEEIDYLCQGPVQGFKVILHSPAEIPQPSKGFFRVSLDQRVMVSVKPNMLETSANLQDYLPSRKLCFMNSERKLRFFKIYTQRHCEMECISNYTQKRCGCVSFAYPRDKNTPICGLAAFKCTKNIVRKNANSKFYANLKNKSADECNCLPACTSITYDVEISPGKFDFEKFYNIYGPIINLRKLYENVSYANLKVSFKENEFITSKRSELYGRTEFFAACGGLLGLFLGITALSFVEIIYYFTLRLVWTLRMYRYWKEEKPVSTIATNIKLA